MVNKKQTVILNGKTYDVATGKPLETKTETKKTTQKATPKIISDISPVRSSGHITKPSHHKRASVASIAKKERGVAPHTKQPLQKSTTLRRSGLKKPVSKVRPSLARSYKHIQKSENITKFAPHKKVAEPKKTNIDRDLLAQTRALEKAQEEYMELKKHHTNPISPSEIKEHLLGEAVAKITTEEPKSHKPKSPKRRFRGAVSTGFAVLLLGGYLTYINIPNLSIRVAAANSGFDATLPTYQPSGYHLHGPITYRSGEVNVKYKQSGSDTGYKITQRPTDWDPIATLSNYVEEDSNNNYQIHSVQGLTVYTYGKKAVWVNDSKLHIITGNASLSNQQVERIVSSM